jgi:hypothetical protein
MSGNPGATDYESARHDLILRSEAKPRVSKDAPARRSLGGFWIVLRGPFAAPQDEGLVSESR